MKRRFCMDEVINLTENCYYVTTDDVVDLCDLRDIGFENVRWVKDIFSELGGCWIAEKDESDGNGENDGGMMVCLSTRVWKMLNDVCERDRVTDKDRRNKVEDLMYELCDKLDKWNGKSEWNDKRNDKWNDEDGANRVNEASEVSEVSEVIRILENLSEVFREIRGRN